MVGSFDEHCIQYTSTVRKQRTAKYLQFPEDMIRELLFNFYEKNGFLPENILVYREGLNANAVPKMLYVSSANSGSLPLNSRRRLR
jgi:hypothetical protein